MHWMILIHEECISQGECINPSVKCLLEWLVEDSWMMKWLWSLRLEYKLNLHFLWKTYGIWWKSLTRSGWVFVKISLWEKKHYGNRIVSELWLCHQAFNWVHVCVILVCRQEVIKAFCMAMFYFHRSQRRFASQYGIYTGVGGSLWFKNNELVGKVWVIMEPWLAVCWIIKEPVLTWNHGSPKIKEPVKEPILNCWLLNDTHRFFHQNSKAANHCRSFQKPSKPKTGESLTLKIFKNLESVVIANSKNCPTLVYSLHSLLR